MNACNHTVRQKDHYGETCLLCGETLAGYGCGRRRQSLWRPKGEGQDHCHHVWKRINDLEVCRYCERTRKYDPAEKKAALALIRAARSAAPQMIWFIETWLVANVSPREIEALVRKAGGKNPEQWRLVAEYFYDPHPEGG